LEIYYPTFIEDLEDMTLNVYLAKLWVEKLVWKIEVDNLFVPLKNTHFITSIKKGK
jgi:hypothetical protein